MTKLQDTIIKTVCATRPLVEWPVKSDHYNLIIIVFAVVFCIEVCSAVLLYLVLRYAGTDLCACSCYSKPSGRGRSPDGLLESWQEGCQVQPHIGHRISSQL